MPRESRTRIREIDPRDRTLRSADGPREATKVSASPVAVVAKPDTNSEIEGFIKGLSELNPRLAAKFDESDRKDRSAGADAAKSGMSAEQARQRSKSFLEGYMEGSGEAAAIRDLSELQERYERGEVDKQYGDVNPLISGHYEQKMRGITDPVYRRGFDRIYSQGAQKLRQSHGENLARAAQDTARATAQVRIDYETRRAIEAGETLGPEYAARVGEIARDARLTTTEADEQLFLSLKRYSDEGNADVWAITELPRIDPHTGKETPGMYHNPVWKQKIDAARQHALTAGLARKEAQERAAKREREERQMVALMPVMDLYLAGDTEGANRELQRLSQDRSLFSRGDELVAFRRLARQAEVDIERPGEEGRVNDWMVEIYREASPSMLMRIVNDEAISAKSKKSLLAEARAEMSRRRAEANDARRTAAAEKSSANAWVRDPQFDASRDNIRAALKPQKGMFDKIDDSDAALTRAAAQAEAEFINWNANNPNATAAERAEQSRVIIDRYRKQAEYVRPQGGIGDATRAAEVLARQGVPYRSHAELLADYKAGTLDPDTFMHYSSILTQVRGSTKQ